MVGFARLDGRPAGIVANQPAVLAGTLAYVCRQFTCERPVSDPASLAEVLGRPASLVEGPG